MPGAQVTDYDTPLTISPAISISDPDAGANPVEVTLSATDGTLTLSGTTDLTFSVGDGTDDADMTFTGTIYAINTALDGMIFTPTSGFSGDASLSITTDDQGYTGSGGPRSDSDTLPITVNPPDVPPPFTVTTTDDSGPGSLRQVILDANANPGTDTITFDIPGTGPHTITPLTELPAITDPVIIDGTTQPGAGCDSWPPTLNVELDGTNAGTGANGLTVSADDALIQGLVINRFEKNGILVNGDRNTITCNMVGTDASGTAAANHENGIVIADAQNNIIGGENPNESNIIAFNGQNGIVVLGSALYNAIQVNSIILIQRWASI